MFATGGISDVRNFESGRTQDVTWKRKRDREMGAHVAALDISLRFSIGGGGCGVFESVQNMGLAHENLNLERIFPRATLSLEYNTHIERSKIRCTIYSSDYELQYRPRL